MTRTEKVNLLLKQYESGEIALRLFQINPSGFNDALNRAAEEIATKDPPLRGQHMKWLIPIGLGLAGLSFLIVSKYSHSISEGSSRKENDLSLNTLSSLVHDAAPPGDRASRDMRDGFTASGQPQNPAAGTVNQSPQRDEKTPGPPPAKRPQPSKPQASPRASQQQNDPRPPPQQNDPRPPPQSTDGAESTVEITVLCRTDDQVTLLKGDGVLATKRAEQPEERVGGELMHDLPRATFRIKLAPGLYSVQCQRLSHPASERIHRTVTIRSGETRYETKCTW